MNSKVETININNKKKKLMEKIYYFLWALFLILTPFYFFASGTPQVSDYLMVLLGGLVFIKPRLNLHRETVPVLFTLGLFVFYITIVNFVWIILLNETSLAWNSLFYIYNLIVVAIFFHFYTKYKESFLLITTKILMLAVFLQTALSIFFIDFDKARQILFFNNPNQLGYFALLCATFFYFANKHFYFKMSHKILFYLCTFYLAALSLSSAALVGFGLFFIIMFLENPKLIFLITVVVLLLYPIIDADLELYQRVDRRFTTMGVSADDSLAGRGYDRIINHPQYLFLGAGEGENSRFDSQLSGEMHSSIGTILFSYGVVGLGLFLALLYKVYKRAGSRPLIELIPVFFYGFTHQGLRWPLFWLLIFFVFTISIVNNYDKENLNKCLKFQ